MEIKNIYGNTLSFYAVEHDNGLCREFILENSVFSFIRWLLFAIALSMLGLYLELHEQNTERLFGALVLLVILLIIKLHLKVTKESLLVIASLGIQLTTTFASGRTTTQFVEATHVHDVIINEAVTMHRIIFYLAILQNGINYQNKTERLMPLFQNFYPRLDCLRKIYEGVQKVLFHKSKDTLVDIKFT